MNRNTEKIGEIGILLTSFFYGFTNKVLAGTSTNDAIGNIGRPEHLNNYGDLKGGGLVFLLSNVLKTAMVIAGLWTFINLILAGFTYVTSGDKPEDLKKANSQITNSLIGLAIIVSSFTIAAIVGWILYGDASALLNPKIYGPGN